MIHELKTEAQFFEAVIQEKKTFEVRKNDRDFRVKDFLALNELDDTREGYTGRSILLFITYVLTDEKYCKPGYAILGFRICAVYPIAAKTKAGDTEILLEGVAR